MKGIILAGDSGTSLHPITKVTSKQLMPIYDKPMIYYPLSILMEAEIKDILIISTPLDQSNFEKLLGDGSDFGINLSYKVQPSPDGLAQAFIIGQDFIGEDSCAMILGDNIFYGEGLKYQLLVAKTNADKGIATIFGYHVHDPQRFGVVEFDDYNKAISIEEKPVHPKSHYAVTGLYFYDKTVVDKVFSQRPSKRGELEITDLNQQYLQAGKLEVITMGEGVTWFDNKTFDSFQTASTFVSIIQKHQNITICCPEEIGYRNGWIPKEKLLERAELMKDNAYGQHLLNILADE